jgi:hypothetical protein
MARRSAASNGVVLSPDEEKTLCANAGQRMFKYGEPDGSLGPVTLRTARHRDGMKVDRAGNVYSTAAPAAGIVRVTSPAGKLWAALPLVDTNQRQICATNIAFDVRTGTACPSRRAMRYANPIEGDRCDAGPKSVTLPRNRAASHTTRNRKGLRARLQARAEEKARRHQGGSLGIGIGSDSGRAKPRRRLLWKRPRTARAASIIVPGRAWSPTVAKSICAPVQATGRP